MHRLAPIVISASSFFLTLSAVLISMPQRRSLAQSTASAVPGVPASVAPVPVPTPSPSPSPSKPAPVAPGNAVQTTGVLAGVVALPSGAPLKNAVVYIGDLPAASWSVPNQPARISQRGARFQPDFLVVPVGQTVEMPNDDRITHNVFSVSPPKRFDLGHYSQGEKRSVRFDKPGIVELYCNIHENMQATIVVAPSAFFVRPAADGTYRIGDLPAGKYPATAYSVDGGTTIAVVEIQAGKTLTQSFILPRG